MMRAQGEEMTATFRLRLLANPVLCSAPGCVRANSANISPGNMILTQDFKEFIQSLNDNDVRYLIVGGYAVSFHGHPRYTKALNIWVGIDEHNAGKVVRALDQFGFASLALTPADFLEPDTTIQLGYLPNRIDLLMGLTGVDFDSCHRDRHEEEIDGIILPFIDLENLKRNKKATGRLQDLADLENLE